MESEFRKIPESWGPTGCGWQRINDLIYFAQFDVNTPPPHAGVFCLADHPGWCVWPLELFPSFYPDQIREEYERRFKHPTIESAISAVEFAYRE